MRFIIGTGGCGFQRISHIMGSLGQKPNYKISPRKMQNSFEIGYNNFIGNKLNNNHEILIGPFYLKHLKSIITPSTKIICLKGDKEKTVNSLMVHFGFRNPLIKDRSNYSRYNLDFFDDYYGMDNLESINHYYEDYYSEVEKLKTEYPNNILIVTPKNYFEDEDTQKEVNTFLGVNGIVMNDIYKLKDEVKITTSLHGGLGNNLFQMIEALVFAEINDLPEPEFKTWDCGLLPSCNNSDTILGGHGGTWEDFNNSFKNIKFSEPAVADFDTKFIVNDMFDFKILHKYRDIILEKFKPSEDIVNYVNEKYSNILVDSSSLHIRTWNSKGDVHDMPLKDDYYVKSLSEIESKNIIVFTDNIKNCRSTLNSLMNQFPNKSFHLINENQFVSLFMISMCENNIVNISTFSFWGAYLNKNQPNNVTTVPSNFGHLPNMLCFDEWVKI